MNDVFGYIAYGENELYHRGALLSALKLLHHCPTARITVATDRPELFRGYPIETMLITTEQKDQWSFGGSYHFGIKAGTMRELLRRADRLLFMDTDMYPVGDPSKGFHSISAIHSIMRLCEGKHRIYQRALPGKNISIGGQVLTGQEPMWNSGVVGIHRESLSAMVDAFAAIKVVHEVTDTWAPKQFCLGVALSQNGRTISPHRLPIRHYNTRGKKQFAEPRVHAFFNAYGSVPVGQQVAKAGRYRLWRTPLDLWHQKHRKSL
ncbi:hypothetical protein X727_31570 [Mesorhizobium sp. L103C119B0]|uniref:hypothetical protein n=1 Tax=Mesorhizobium sp. L103C119B0 TaxID=1287085 RepID=UPI0003CFE348|nr:hypothetical protein [Mesorhizobium sp. L103C119B0]ESZ59456.1 hypothetical protein X727_31570 [Mesorhizobium sp. L103C119B0]